MDWESLWVFKSIAAIKSSKQIIGDSGKASIMVVENLPQVGGVNLYFTSFFTISFTMRSNFQSLIMHRG
ncbi:hypothetical protein SAMN04487935_1936 [Flavobacterium noncentrifugens]|uniref:Uncharacterized protein n=1 Tax=Flavobacterium noncentrifugens TaxID=1128970 RepID=A0A1G8WST5_9FLAO|nr:hypothetical protein SAMN04487935_1936 [Flavobacterium noncentrifugens]